MANDVKRLKAHLAEVYDLECAGSVLGWDQQTQMPPGGGAQRANVLSTLSRLAHHRFASRATERLLDAAESEVASLPDDHDDRCLVRHTRREYERSRKLPDAFVAAWTQDATLSNEVWRVARKANDFAAFAPHLAKMVEYARRAADYYGWEAHPYDALLEGYEPGMTSADVERVFAGLRTEQVALARAIAEQPSPRVDFLSREYPLEAQRRVGLAVAEAFGYDLSRGRLDIAPHPFETSFGRDDVRITTRYSLDEPTESLYATWHETGHALYEQNIAPELARTPLSGGCSLVFHESQSRMWENIVGRSRGFCEYAFPLLQDAFPDALADVTPDDWYRGVNRVRPSLIRVEADEVTYNLHVMLRFDLERALVEGRLSVADLPNAWRAKMEEYLGVTPPDDRDGVMQDSHWSGGSIGYFPTYALGNVMAAQIYETVTRQRPALEEEIGRGEFSGLRDWLTEAIYRHGRKFTPRELALKVNGAPLDSAPYLRYLKRKYTEIYNL